MDLDSGQQTMANSVPVAIASNQSALPITDNSGSLTIDGSVTALGDVAHDVADSGNPVKTGSKAIAALSGATLVSAADRTNDVSDLDGAKLVRQDFALGDIVSGNAAFTAAAGTLLSSAGAGVKQYITDIALTNSSATFTYVEIKDGGTAKFTLPVPASSGVVKTFKTPLGGTAATDWAISVNPAVGTLYASATGFKSKI